MNNPRISLIAAIGENRELGRNNKLLWHIPEDLKRFKTLTLNHPIIMGRKTFESIGRPLPKRTNIVITRDTHFSAEGVVVVHSLEDAIKIATSVIASETKQSQDNRIVTSSRHGGTPRNDNNGEIFIIGGGQIFAEALPLVDRLYLTIVGGAYQADTFFPEYSEFTKVISEEHGKSGEYIYTFLVLEK